MGTKNIIKQYNCVIIKKAILLLLPLLFFFSSCKTKQEQFLESENCCQQYIKDRTLFLDSLFVHLFPEKFNNDSALPHTINIRDINKIFQSGNTYNFQPLNIPDSGTTILVWKSVHFTNVWGLGKSDTSKKRPNSELIPKFIVELYYQPDSICNTLTERWVFYSDKEITIYVPMLGTSYIDEYVVFDYMVKENKLTSTYSDEGFIDDILYDIGIISEASNNRKNIKRVKNYGTLKFDTLMRWKESYLDTVALDCVK